MTANVCMAPNLAWVRKIDGTLCSSSLWRKGRIRTYAPRSLRQAAGERSEIADLSLGAKIVAPETVNGLATVLAFVNLTISHSRKRDMCLKKRIPTILVPTGHCTAPHHSNVRTSTTDAQSPGDKSSRPMIKC